MNELLSWGLPITLIGIAVAGAFAALQQNDAGPEEYWIAGGCFVLAGLVVMDRHCALASNHVSKFALPVFWSPP